MKFGTYRNVAMKSVNVRAAKNGLRLLAKSTPSTVECKAIVGLNLGLGLLVRVTTPYLLGDQLSNDVRAQSLDALADVGYNLVLLARTLKVKLPTSTKKVKLVGTVSLGILTLAGMAYRLLDYVDGVFIGPAMKSVEKEIVLPNEGGKKELRVVSVVDREQENADEKERQEQVKAMFTPIIDQYWKLVYSLTGQTPEAAFTISETALRMKSPELFEHIDEGEADTEDAGEEEAEVKPQGEHEQLAAE
jgi:hypothetical protein